MKSLLVLLVLAAASVAVYVWSTGPAVGDVATPADDATSELVAEAESLHDAGDHARSAELYRQAARTAAAAGDDDLALAYRAQSAVCLKKAGDTSEALEIMEASLAQARERQLRRVEGLALGNLARLHDLEGDPERGLAYRDALVEFALDDEDTRLAVWTLEQAAAAALDLGDAQGALERLDRALALDPLLGDGERRGDAMRRTRAWALARRGDDEGAAAAWRATEPTGASLANRAQHLALLGRHVDAAEVAYEAAEAFEYEGDAGGARDRAMLLWIRELIRARQIEEADKALFQLLGQADGDDFDGDAERELAEAPFRAMLARVALAQGRFDDALEDLGRARDVLEREVVAPDDAARLAAVADEAFELDVLSVVALGFAGRTDDALGVLSSMEPDQARGALRAWLATRDTERTWLAADAFELLEPTADGLDGSVARMREALPFDLAPVASLVLDATLGDLVRIREAGTAGDQTEVMVDRALAGGARLALIWQALELLDDVPGLDPADSLGAITRVDAWISGDLPEGTAVAALIAGDVSASLVLCVSGRPVTTFGISPPSRLSMLLGDAIDGLRSNDVDAMAEAAYALTKEVVPKPAFVDLEDTSHVTWILPGPMAAYPPAAYVASTPMARQPVEWLAYRFTHSLLPHALVGGGDVAVADDARTEWLRVGAPAADPSAAPFVTSHAADVYGDEALAVTRMRESDEPALDGEEATPSALRDALPTALALELSAPAFGAGRLGGVLLTPDEDATFGDERGGFVPWHRFAELPLPPVVIADRSRFGPTPGDTPDFAATALMARAQAVLLTRWPSPVEPELMLRRIIERLRAGSPLGDAVTLAQRDFLTLVRTDLSAQHPRNWAPWLAYALR